MATNHGPFSNTEINDFYVYSQYFDFLHRDGLVPYRDFDFEYPPGALVPIGLAGDDAVILSLLMLLCAVGTQLAAWAIGGARAGWAMVGLPVLAGAIVRARFDLLPVALAVGGLALVLRRDLRWSAEGGLALLALGTMTKLWPAAVAAVAVAWLAGRGEWRAAVRSSVVFAAVCLAIGLPFAIVGDFPSTMVQFHVDRPVQIESTAASVLEMLGGTHVTGAPIAEDGFKSNGLDGGPADLVLALFTGALLISSLAIVALVARRPSPDAVVLAALAVTLAFVGFGKVFSPQYVCWLLPLAAVAYGRGARLGPALVALAALVTQLWFPGRYFDVVYQHDWAIVAVGVRNALILLALAATARALARSPGPAAAAPRSG